MSNGMLQLCEKSYAQSANGLGMRLMVLVRG